MPRKNTPVKFTAEEVKSLEDLQKDMDQIIVQAGQLQVQKINLEDAEKRIVAHLANLKTKEAEIAKSLTEKYGKGTLNIESGEFTPAPNTEDTTAS